MSHEMGILLGLGLIAVGMLLRLIAILMSRD